MAICISSQRGGVRGDHGLTPASSQRGEAMSTFSFLLAWPLALPFLDSGRGEACHLHIGLRKQKEKGEESSRVQGC